MISLTVFRVVYILWYIWSDLRDNCIVIEDLPVSNVYWWHFSAAGKQMFCDCQIIIAPD
jgi:hypothetical protein